MGAWNDLLISIKGSIAGPVPFGGTIFPTSDNFPTMAAQLLKGGFFTLENLDQLKDIPYQNLQLDQEVVVSASPTHERTRYRLIQLPPPGVRISDNPGWNYLEFWEPVAMGGGGAGEPGPPGTAGWTPVLALETDGPIRVVMRLMDWTGGTGIKPAIPPPPYPSTDVYIGPSGFTSKSGATNLKGDKGDKGDVLTVRPEFYQSLGTRILVGYTNSVSGEPQLPWKRWPPSGYSAGVALDLVGAFAVKNTWTQARRFRVSAQANISNGSGFIHLQATLYKNGFFADGNFSSIDQASREYGSGTHRSVHKILLQDCPLIDPGVTANYTMKLALMYGTQGYITDPFFEAWGL